ncbi:MAG TPA: methyltransferase domain-containing protein [Actinoplanes sp.]
MEGDTGGVGGCCDPRGYEDIFGARFARRQARRYRKHGLDAAAQRIVDFLTARGIEDATVLEIGGGVGEIQLELLRRGAAQATNLELVDTYDAPARELAAEAGMTGRMSRRLLDIAAAPSDIGAADIVVLHRVVCCYPDYSRLLGAAADHARRLLVFSHPPRNSISRAIVATQNCVFRVTGRSYRAFTHPPAAMVQVLSGHGMRVNHRRHATVWQVVGAERVPTGV